MKQLFRTSGRISCLAAVAVLLTLVAGCSNQEEKASKPPAPAQPQYVTKTVPRPDTSHEFQRIYTYLKDGKTLVKLEIQYRDGRAEVQHYRPDQTISQIDEMHQYTTKVKSVTKYGADGSTALEKSTYRMTGTLESHTTYQPDGSSRTLKYRVDGQRLHSETIEPSQGPKTITFYRQDGKTLWAKAKVEGSGDTRLEYYDDAGKLSQLREKSYNEKRITVYDANGVARYRQTWYGYYNSSNLDKVEEFAADGKTVKRLLEFRTWGDRELTSATDFENGKKVRQRSYRYDGTLRSEEIFNADGTSKTEDHEASEGKRETYGKELSEEPKFDDPLSDNPANFS